MQNVTDAWKTEHTGMLLPETFLEISYDITEPGIQEAANITATTEESFSDAQSLSIVGETDARKYSHLEWNAWGLDGSFEYFYDSMPDMGYVTENLSSEESGYAVFPTIEINFAQVHTVPIAGITISWSPVFGEWAEDFRITVYNDVTQVAQQSVTGNKSTKSIVWMRFENYNRITIEVLKWCLPYRRARAVQTRIGISTTYTKRDLLNFSASQSIDLLTAALPKNELRFSLDNSTDIWNPDNPSGAEQYLLERQKITLRHGMRVNGGIEWINGGSFWLSEWNTPANGLEASFTGRDALAFANIKYTGRTAGTLYAVAEDALEQLSQVVDGVSYVISDELKNHTIDFSGKTESFTVSGILQMVAHAGVCLLYQDRTAVIHIEPRNGNLTDYEITLATSYGYPEYTLLKPLKSIEVGYGDGLSVSVSASASGEVQTVENPLIQTEEMAKSVGEATKALLINRKTESGEFRADPRLDAGDTITVNSKFSANAVVITDIEYSVTGGACRGRYTGRVIDGG